MKRLPIGTEFFIPLLVTVLGMILGRYGWVSIQEQMDTVSEQYWIGRAHPFASSAIPATIIIAIILLAQTRLRLGLTLGFIPALLFMVAYLGAGEYARLAPYIARGYTSKAALAGIDNFVIAGLGIALLALGGALFILLKQSRAFSRSASAVYGDTDWMNMDDAAKLFPPDGEIIIGERYRPDLDSVRDIDFNPRNSKTWGKGGKAPLLTYKMDFDSTHMLFFAGSGGYKTVSNVIPTALTYTGPIVCLDPANEVTPIVLKEREKLRVRGGKVYVLDPEKADVGFNVLDFIFTSTRPEEDISAVAKMLCAESYKSESTSAQYFSNQAMNLLTGLLAYIVFSDEYDGKRTLRSLRGLVSTNEPVLKLKLEEIYKMQLRPFISETIGVFVNMTEQTFSGVYSTASKDTQWLSFEGYSKLVCGNNFTTADLAKKGDIDIFLNLRGDTLQSYPGIARVIIGSLLNGMIQADGHFKKRVLYLLDEADLLGYMSALTEARDRGRKFGNTLALFYQSYDQLVNHFGPAGANAWIEGAAFSSYAAIKSQQTAKSLETLCGTVTAEVQGSSQSAGFFGSIGSGRASVSTSLQRRPLILQHEVLQEMRKDEQIIIVGGQRPLRVGRAIYFRRPELQQKADQNRFVSAKP